MLKVELVDRHDEIVVLDRDDVETVTTCTEDKTKSLVQFKSGSSLVIDLDLVDVWAGLSPQFISDASIDRVIATVDQHRQYPARLRTELRSLLERTR